MDTAGRERARCEPDRHQRLPSDRPPGLEVVMSAPMATPRSTSQIGGPLFAIEGGRTWAETDKGSIGALSQVTASALTGAGVGAGLQGMGVMATPNPIIPLPGLESALVPGGAVGSLGEDGVAPVLEEERSVPGRQFLDNCVEELQTLVDNGWTPDRAESTGERLVGAAIGLEGTECLELKGGFREVVDAIHTLGKTLDPTDGAKAPAPGTLAALPSFVNNTQFL